jgi:hypothetical protein
VNVETKVQPKQWMYTHSLEKLKKFLTNVCQKTDGHCFLGQESKADGGIHASRDINNIISV